MKAHYHKKTPRIIENPKVILEFSNGKLYLYSRSPCNRPSSQNHLEELT